MSSLIKERMRDGWWEGTGWLSNHNTTQWLKRGLRIYDGRVLYSCSTTTLPTDWCEDEGWMIEGMVVQPQHHPWTNDWREDEGGVKGGYWMVIQSQRHLMIDERLREGDGMVLNGCLSIMPDNGWREDEEGTMGELWMVKWKVGNGCYEDMGIAGWLLGNSVEPLER